MSLLVEVRNLRKYFPIERGVFRKTRGFIKAIDGISFGVEKGKTLGIVGLSGSGKTTLAKLLLRLILPTSGEIIYNPAEIANFRRDVQIIFQNPYQSLDPKMRIGAALTEPLIVHRLCPKFEFRQRLISQLQAVGLAEEVLIRLPSEFSGGQRQRICLARALILQPKFLILDEPVSSLDLTRQIEIIDLLRNLKNRFNLSYVFISHNLKLVKEIADSVLVLEDGRIVC